MPYDGAGLFTRSFNWTTDKANGIKIRADRMDSEFDNFAAALNQVIMRNGVTRMSGDFLLGGNKVTEAGDGSAASPSFHFINSGNSGLYLIGAGIVGMAAGGVESLRFTSTGVGTNNITFPAVQVPSANANTLDDYEEGTWPPVLKFGGVSAGITGTFAGEYTKTGDSVLIQGRIGLTSKGANAGSSSITGLPFAPSKDVAVFIRSAFMNVATVQVGSIIAGTTTILLEKGNGAASDNTDFTNVSSIQIFATYKV